MPIDYRDYPPNWRSEIVPRIRLRAGNRCERCGVKNWVFGWRDGRGQFRSGTPPRVQALQLFYDPHQLQGPKQIRIILTVAHLDHDEKNWEVPDSRLALLCQYCHLQHDRADNTRRTRYGKAHAAHPRLPL